MTTPEQPSPSGATLGQGFALLGKAVMAVAQQLQIMNQLSVMRIENLDWRDTSGTHLGSVIPQRLGMKEAGE